MNVLLINPNHNDFTANVKSAPLGLLSIATYSKQRGFRVRIYDRNTEKTSLEKAVAAFRPDVVGLSVPSYLHIRDSIAVSHWLREKGLPVVWGGHIAFDLPEMILREGCADYVVSGEGEITFHALLEALEKKLDITQIKGLAYLDAAGAFCRTPEREFADLADFPPIDWTLVDPRKYFAPHVHASKMLYVYCSKGCPARCAFCINEAYYHCKYRKRPNAHVISELKVLVNEYGLDGANFSDEMFGADKDDLYDLCAQLRELHIFWGCQTRLGHLKREDLRHMYDAGCRWIYFGVESGSPETLRRIRKGIDLSRIDLDFRYCREIGIVALSGFIIGFPDETQEQVQETVRLILRLNPSVCRVNHFNPYPNSELYQQLIESGRMAPSHTLQEMSDAFSFLGKVPYNFSQVPARDLRVIQSFFLWQTLSRTKLPKGSTWLQYVFSMLLSLFENLFAQGVAAALRHLFSPVRLFLSTAWYRFAYPGIRKKYGLRRNRETGNRSQG